VLRRKAVPVYHGRQHQRAWLQAERWLAASSAPGDVDNPFFGRFSLQQLLSSTRSECFRPRESHSFRNRQIGCSPIERLQFTWQRLRITAFRIAGSGRGIGHNRIAYNLDTIDGRVEI